nr:hypothetical protein [uncultured Desulfobacter sp.]
MDVIKIIKIFTNYRFCSDTANSTDLVRSTLVPKSRKKLKEYSGTVFFVDILGVGALTQGKIKITQEDFIAHRFRFKERFSEHQFCAKLLVKFRRILTTATQERKAVKVAQLSDCAFIWSDNADLVVNVAREIMWNALFSGVLCRGGLHFRGHNIKFNFCS